jgi:hypothetical protein
MPTAAAAGLHNISEVWQYEEWENVTRITSWSPPHVEHVRGTDAFQFRPGLALGSSVEVWVGELYRAARLLAKEKVGGSLDRLLALLCLVLRPASSYSVWQPAPSLPGQLGGVCALEVH